MRHQLSEWAAAFGVPDPMPIASEALDCEPETLHEAFVQTRQATVGVWQGTNRVEDTRGLLAGAWSAPEPSAALRALIRAGWSTRAVLVRQADQASRTSADLASCRSAMLAALKEAEGAITATGFPLTGGAQHAAVAASPAWGGPSAKPIIERFLAEANLQQVRVRATLADLADALAVDPLTSTTSLVARHPMFARLPDRSTQPERAADSAEEANLRQLELDLRSGDGATYAAARGIKDALEEARARGDEATLVLYEPAHDATQARAAVAIGDLARASRTTIVAPGITSSPTDMSGALVDASNLQHQSEWAGDEKTAVVAWFGYDIPASAPQDSLGGPTAPLAFVRDLEAATDDDAAVRGGAQLIQDMAALRTMMPADAMVTAVGFSMGSTTVSQAARMAHVFDNVVLMGSPGAGEGVRSVDDYPGMDPDDVWVNAFDHDPVTQTRLDLLVGGFNLFRRTIAPATHPPGNEIPFGMDPAGEGFGAQVMDMRSPADAAGWGNHTSANYFTGSSLQALSAVMLGQGSQVPVRRGR